MEEFVGDGVWKIIVREWNLEQRGPTAGQRPLITRPTKLFVTLLLVTTSSFIAFMPKDLGEKIVIFISSAALRTSATHMLLTLKPCCKK
jgi:hypothetical protein